MAMTDLIRQLTNSAADNAAIEIVSYVRQLGDRFDWTLEEQQAVGAAMIEVRQSAMRATVESLEVVLKGVLK